MKKSQFESLIREVIRETIRKVDGKYVVYPEKGGKRLGTHSTKKAAEKQLTAIHLNKEAYEKGKVIIYHNFQGVDADENIAGTNKVLNVADCIGNEPGKDYKYFTTEKKKYVEDMIRDASGEGWKSFEPIVAIPHPFLSGKYAVIDGNHRLGAFIIGKIPQINAKILSDDKILLAERGAKWNAKKLPKTMPLADAKKQGINLKEYFATKPLNVPSNENYADGKVNEAKQVGNLYHYTSADGLKGILQSNSLNASEEEYLGNELYYISFTRNKNFHNKGQNFNVKTDYRITLDGDKLSNRYKIKPFAYIPGWNYTDNWEYDWLEDEPESVARDFFNSTGDYDEQEERISFKDASGLIPNIKDYILKVDKVSDLKENYADGKVKGKSRPGRVKRSGASCKGSVTDLRAKAKKYGGEKGKMYHWCANMKGGKKK